MTIRAISRNWIFNRFWIDFILLIAAFGTISFIFHLRKALRADLDIADKSPFTNKVQ